MFSTYEKTFTSDATVPTRIHVTAVVEDATCKITDIVPCGGLLLPPTGVFKAESKRMHAWLRTTFIGQHVACFNTHNGVVPGPFSIQVSDRRFAPLRAVNLDFKLTIPKDEKTQQAISRVISAQIEQAAMQQERDAHKKLRGALGDAHVPPPWVEKSHGVQPPEPGTFWQSRNVAFMRVLVLSVEEKRHGKFLARLKRVDEKGKNDRSYVVEVRPNWGKKWERIYDTEQLKQHYRNFLNSVEFKGTELPPKEGERYFSIVLPAVYKVIDVRQKLYSKDYAVLMEREEDGHRSKFTYRDHASWCATWRPVDDNGMVCSVVEIAADEPKAARVNQPSVSWSCPDADPIRDLERADYLDDLVRVYDELHRRVPGWNNKSLHEPGRTEADLAVRAIREMARDLGIARKNFEAERALKNELLKAKNHFQAATRATEQHRQMLIQSIRAAAKVLGVHESRADLIRLFGRSSCVTSLSDEQLLQFHVILCERLQKRL